MKRIYIDMDDVLCDFVGDFKLAKSRAPEVNYPQAELGFFHKLRPLPAAIESVNRLRELADVYILSAPSIYNAHSYTEKRLWIEDHFGFEFTDRLILSRYKNLLKGDYLIDDYEHGRGQEGFEGELLVFGSERFPDWTAIMDFVIPNLIANES